MPPLIGLLHGARDFPGGASGKRTCLPTQEMLRDASLVPGWEDPLEATHFSHPDWRISWTEEPSRLQSKGSQSWTRLKQLNRHEAGWALIQYD